MKKSKFNDSQIMSILKQASAGLGVSEICRTHDISSATFYKWRSKYSGMDLPMITKLKELELENSRLKKSLEFHDAVFFHLYQKYEVYSIYRPSHFKIAYSTLCTLYCAL